MIVGTGNHRSTAWAAFSLLAFAISAGWGSARAQVSGPMAPPASRAPAPPPAASKPEAPPIPPEEIIRRFAQKEDEMVRAIAGMSFQQSLRLEEVGQDGKPSGQVEIVSSQFPGPDGRRYQKVVRRTESTLRFMQVERGDLDGFTATPMFPLTTAQLPRYEISFEGKQPLDELSVYVFAVKPRSLDRVRAYFSGVVWVDEQDLVIVKTIGKWVTETGDVSPPMYPFTLFETYRQQVGKDLWMPAYSRSDSELPEGKSSVPIRMVIRWSDYAPYTSGPATPPAASNSPEKSSTP
jgi:hypothetical protein